MDKTACNFCKKRKIKCSGDPCSQCEKRRITCVFASKPKYIFINGINAQKLEFEQGDEYYGPSSTQTFIKKLYLYLKGIESTSDECGHILQQIDHKVLEGSGSARVPNSLHLSQDGITKCLDSYYDSFHVPCPMMLPGKWIPLVKLKWSGIRNGEYGTLTRADLMCIYMLISMGAFGFSSKVLIDGFPIHSWAQRYLDCALKIMPSILGSTSLPFIQGVTQLARCSAMRGDINVAYIQSGIATRAAFSLGLHCFNPDSSTRNDKYELYMTWISVYGIEKHTSLLAGRPSSIGLDIVIPDVAPLRNAGNVFNTGSSHCSTRIKILTLSINLLTEVHKDIKQLKDIADIYKKIKLASAEIDQLASIFPHAVRDRSGELDYIDDQECKEWFWLRVFYLHLRMSLFRPFLIFSVYVDMQKAFDSVPKEILQEGSNCCLEAALELPTMILTTGERLCSYATNSFWSMYIEPAASILLLYILMHASDIHEDMAVKIWIALSHSSTYLDSGLGPSFSYSRTLVKDAISTLRNILEKQNHRQLLSNPIEFSRIFFGGQIDLSEAVVSPGEDMSNYWLSIFDSIFGKTLA